MRLLEIFSGTGSIGKPWREAGHDVISIDIEGRYNPEICEDILQLSYQDLPVPDVIWASPPCQQYSIARSKAKVPRQLQKADALAKRAWEIIQFFRVLNSNLLFFIENPDSSLLWKREVAIPFTPQIRLDYCAFGAPYRKRTRIATNADLTPRPLCNPAICPACVDGRHRMSAQKGPSRGNDFQLDSCSTDQLHTIPKELCEEIYCVCVSAQLHFP
jgi:hypothetical protein